MGSDSMKEIAISASMRYRPFWCSPRSRALPEGEEGHPNGHHYRSIQKFVTKVLLLLRCLNDLTAEYFLVIAGTTR